MTPMALGIHPRLVRVLAAIIFILLAAFLPLLMHRFLSTARFTFWTNISILAGIYAIAALGLNIIVGYCGLLNLGFAGFMLIGAYTAGILTKEYHWSFWMACIASVAHGAFWGILLGIPTLRLTGDYFAIVTFGFSELVNMTAKNWSKITHGTRGYPGVPRPALEFNWLHSLGLFRNTNLHYEFTILNRTAYWYLTAALLGLCMFVTNRLSRSRLGRAWRALREDEVAAEACGINATWYKTIAFAISAGIGALAGAQLGAYYTTVDFRYFDFMTSVFVLCYVVLGGMGTVIGPVAGAAVLFTLGELLRDSPFKEISSLIKMFPAAHDWLENIPWVPDMRMIVYGLILIIMIRFRPEGLFPSRSRCRELHGKHKLEPVTLFNLRA